MKTVREDIRNIAIVAHVDHGKTTLVDEMLKQGGIFRANQVVKERMMDSNDLERERGITILAKNTAVHVGDIKINIVDTPGHADFGGEVERVLKMVDGVLLLVDAFEGPMPQTKFVLKKALELGHKVIVVINKIDRPDARPQEVVDEVLDLFIEIDADENQLDCPFVFTSARNGVASLDETNMGEDLGPLFQVILDHIPTPQGDEDAPVQVLISTIDYNDYVGRIGIGKVERGTLREGQLALRTNFLDDALAQEVKINNLYEFNGLKRTAVASAKVGDIVAISGIEGINIGDTICDMEHVAPLPFVKISEPTVSITFSVNESPFAGREGKFVTSRHLRARLFREIETDVSLRVQETDSTDAFIVMGRGELHMSILIETMRRQGYEFQVSKPVVIYKEMDGVKCEPMEHVTIDVPEPFMGAVMEQMGRRRGELTHMQNGRGGSVRLEFLIPSRGLFGYRSDFLTDTRGEGILNAVFAGYAKCKDEIVTKQQGALIAFETGEAVAYGLYNAQDRGTLFIGPGTQVYAGMVVGIHARPDDIEVNVCKKKQVTNMRASGSDDALRLVPIRKMTLESAIERLKEDELLEITPQSIRTRKRILDTTARMRANRNKS